MEKTAVFSPTLETRYVNSKLWRKIERLNLQLVEDRMIIKHGWTKEQTEKAIKNYRQFLYTTQVYEQVVAPTGDVDVIWHEHILHTFKYAEDCKNIFGKFLHHLPTPAKNLVSSVKNFVNCAPIGGSETKCGGTTNCQVDCEGPRKSTEKGEPVNFSKIQKMFFLS